MKENGSYGQRSRRSSTNEKPIERSEVPNAVLDAVATKYPAAKLSHFAREIENGKTLYEVVSSA